MGEEKLKLKKYEIWMEGFAATGQSQGAYKLGEEMGRTFKEACHILWCKQYITNKRPDYESDRWDYNPNGPSIWGCGLYDNEKDARKSFG